MSFRVHLTLLKPFRLLECDIRKKCSWLKVIRASAQNSSGSAAVYSHHAAANQAVAAGSPNCPQSERLKTPIESAQKDLLYD